MIFANPIEPDLARQFFARHFDQHMTLAAAVRAELGGAVTQAAQAIVSAFRDEKKVLICGNGGSAADAQHIAAELTGRYETPGRRALPAVALTTDTSALTAISNDSGYADVFARQVEALGQTGDVLVAISTSGRSPNVLRAVEVAKAQGLQTIGLLGCDGGELLEVVQVPVLVPSHRTAHIQEMHITVGHVLCGLVDSAFACQQPSV